MRFAFVNGRRQEAQPGLIGKCPGGDHTVIARCGEIRIWHWAHQKKQQCDQWWETETEWHRAWKEQFPDAWQEIPHPAEDGTRHIADVKTVRGWVLEFQHSHIRPEERRSRDAFYGQLVWIVDGTRRKRDASQCSRAWDEGTPVAEAPLIRLRRVYHPDECALLRDWLDSRSPIFFDFGDGQVLWCLLPHRGNGFVYLAQILRGVFIDVHRRGVSETGTDFKELIAGLNGLVVDVEATRRMG